MEELDNLENLADTLLQVIMDDGTYDKNKKEDERYKSIKVIL